MIAALHDGALSHPWPASVVLAGEYGIEGVAVGVLVRLGPGGVETIDEWDLAPHEMEALQSAARATAEAMRELAISRGAG
jgi:malate dehydrogenase